MTQLITEELQELILVDVTSEIILDSVIGTYSITEEDKQEIADILKDDVKDTYGNSLNALDQNKADKSTTYTKTEVDNSLALKANQSDMNNVQDYLGVDVSKKRNLLDESILDDAVATWKNVIFYGKPNTTYTASTNSNDSTLLFYIYDGIQVSATTGLTNASHNGKVTTNSTGAIGIQYRTASTSKFSDYHWKIEEGETSTPYVPYMPPLSALSNVEDYIGVDITKKRNLWDEQWEVGSINKDTGIAEPNGNTIRARNYIEVKPNTLYQQTGGEIVVSFYSSNFTTLQFVRVADTDGSVYGMSADVVLRKTFTTPTGCKYIRFRCSAVYGNSYKGDISITEGMNLEYIPYVPQLISVRPHSNRNLLMNSWFTVNQRGWTSGNAIGGQYTIDRWQNSTGYLYVEKTSYGILLRNNQTSARFLVEGLESDVVNFLKGKTVTLSMMNEIGVVSSGTIVFPSSGYYDVTVFNTEFRVYASGGINIRVNVGQTLNLRAVKLELGDKSTLAYDSAPNYAEELAKCQRYFQSCRVMASQTYYYSSARRLYRASLPVQLRTTNPTATYLYCVGYMNGGTTVSTTDVNLEFVQDLCVTISATFPSALQEQCTAVSFAYELSADL